MGRLSTGVAGVLMAVTLCGVARALPPVADAGPGQVVFQSLAVDGSGSYDPDGTSIVYDWTLLHTVDPGIEFHAVGAVARFDGLPPGFYELTLLVTDAAGESDLDVTLVAAAGPCTPQSTCPGDFDRDGVVDGTDLGAFAGYYGLAECSLLDMDGDGFAARDDCDDRDPGVNPDAVEVCDHRDNNCDGLVDEGWPELNQPCLVGLGACQAAGIYVCDQNDPAALAMCSAVPGEPAPEACDGLDNNCDGLVDEDWPELNQPCLVGLGTCQAAGTYVCDQNDPAAMAMCSAVPGAPAPEACDGLDNDCDGAVDSGLSAPPCPEQDGVCGGAAQHCGGAAGWLACGPANYGPQYESVEITCDGLDNDCNGAVDDGWCEEQCVPGIR